MQTDKSTVEPRYEWRWPVLLVGGTCGLAAILAVSIWITDHRAHTPPPSSPVHEGGPALIISVADPFKARLFARALSCSLTDQWPVDFSGDGSPYRVERHHCDTQQLSGIDLPSSNYGFLNQGYDFLLVVRSSPNEVVHGELEEGRYTSVKTINVQRRQYLALNGMIWGTSGDHDWCLLGDARSGGISCLQVQNGEVDTYVKGKLRPEENVKAGWNIGGDSESLFLENYVEAAGDPNCCPSRGKIRVDLVSQSGQFYWGKVTRSGSSLHDLGEEVSVGYWTYRCNGARWQDAIISGFSSIERPDAAFLVVDISIRNNDRSPSTRPPLRLIDAQGREYNESSTFMAGSLSPFKTLNPTVSSRGYVVFDAPRSSYRLKLSGGYESGELALVDLTPMSTPGEPPHLNYQ